MEKGNKVIRNGKVAVIVSPGFGAGFVTWSDGISPFEPKIVKMIEEGRQDKITERWCQKELGIKNVYCGGAKDLEIEWLPLGIAFAINEYDGSESIYRSDKLEYYTGKNPKEKSI